MSCTKQAIFYLLAIFLYVSNIAAQEFLPATRQTHIYTGDLRYYSIDGSGNNLMHPRWGSFGSPYARLVPAYSDGVSEFRTTKDGKPLPNVRELSTSLFTGKDVLSNESAAWNVLFYSFSQWVTHDQTFMFQQEEPYSCCDGIKPRFNTPSNVCLPMYPPKNDYHFSKFGVTCLDIKRSINTAILGCSKDPVDQINFQTSWLDLSLVYGPFLLRNNNLRTFRGGQLKKVTLHNANDQVFPPIVPFGCPFGGLQPGEGGGCLKTGDPRLIQNTEMTIHEVIFIRMHNHIAAGLQRVNPKWSDDRLFNEARKILIAKYQHVIYTEMIPAIIGHNLTKSFHLSPLQSGYAEGYDPEINGQILVEFTSVSGRIMHTLIRNSTIYKDELGHMKTYRLKEKAFNQEFLLEGNTVANVIRSFSHSPCGTPDQYVNPDLNNHVFISSTKSPRIYGQDLTAIDISRGRDFGIAPFNVIRTACGLHPIKNFEDLNTIIYNPDKNIPKLKRFYKTIEDVDFYVLALLEKPVGEAQVGPSTAYIFAETYHRSKFGDRLYYEFKSSGFTEDQLQDIRKTKYAQFVCLTNDVTSMPNHSLIIPSATNPELPCKHFGDINFNLFKEI